MHARTQDEHALLQAILASPEDDLPRLALADLLEETGDGDRAEFIRMQIELAHIDAIEHDCGPKGEWETTCAACGAHAYGQSLENMALALLLRHSLEWLSPSPLPGPPFYDLWPIKHGWATTSGPGTEHTRCLVQFQRGLVARIELPIRAFMEHAGAIFKAAPIEEVLMTDRQPRATANEDSFGWYNWPEWPAHGADDLPLVIWGLLVLPASANWKWADTADAALAAASAACVAYGRAQALAGG